MGYFNYFIKCIIRNFAYKLCKPKVFFTVLLSIIILFSLKHFGFCSLDDSDYEMINDGFATITSNQGVLISQLSSIGVDVRDLENSLSRIETQLGSLQGNQMTIASLVNNIYQEIDTLNTNILNIYNRLDSNQKELLLVLNTNNEKVIAEMKEENQKVLDELKMIRESINGTSDEFTSYTDLGIINNNNNDTHRKLKGISINYEQGYTYKIKIYATNPWTTVQTMRVGIFNTPIPNGYNYDDYGNNLFPGFAALPASSSTVITYNVPSTQPKYIYFSFGSFITKIEVLRSINGIGDSLQQNNDLQQQGNQLQQESNQLQQEQNDFLQQGTSDSDVSVDSFNSVDANDITSDGLSGVFTNIYNSINSWSSKDINLPIPHTNKNITIPANYTHNMLSSFGGGWIITFISSIYYFIVARFIIYSITDIINSIKSGSILETDSKNNITTDML